MVPDGDLFNAICAGRRIGRDRPIERFTENGILLESGAELEADIVVTATGLNLLAFGGIELTRRRRAGRRSATRSPTRA